MGRAGRRKDMQSLDSLLDTMANVVGILIVLVAVTQLSLGDAIERIRAASGERAAASPTEVAEIIGQRADVQVEIEAIRSKLEKFVGEERTGMLLADATPLLDEFESLAGASAAAGDRVSTEEVENLRVEVSRLEGDVRTRQGEQEQLLGILAEPSAKPETVSIRLPDPRPVPVGMERVFFFCRGGEVHVVDLEALITAMDAGLHAATGSLRDKVIVEAADVPWILNYFKKERIESQGYRWVFDSDFLAELLPTRGVAAGESLAAIERPGSRTAGAFDALNPRRQYIRFFVWPDSYDVYLQARRMAEERDLRIGWKEMRKDANLRFDVLSGERRGRNLLD